MGAGMGSNEPQSPPLAQGRTPAGGGLNGATSLEKGARETQPQAVTSISPTPPSARLGWAGTGRAMASAAAVWRGSACRSSAGSEDNLGRGDMLESPGSNGKYSRSSRGRGTCLGQARPGTLHSRRQHPQLRGTCVCAQCQTPLALGAVFPVSHGNCDSRAPDQ